MEALSKAILTAVIAGAVLVASFYIAYILIFVLVVGVIGGLAYLFFNRKELFGSYDFYE